MNKGQPEPSRRAGCALILLAALCAAGAAPKNAPEANPQISKELFARLKPCSAARVFDWEALKKGYLSRIRSFQSRGILPVFDVSSSFGNGETNYATVKNHDWLSQALALTPVMNEEGIAVVALSPERSLKGKPFLKSPELSRSNCVNFNVVDLGLDWYFPATAAGNLVFENSDAFWGRILGEALSAHYLMMGEFFFRHYPSNRQVLNAAVSLETNYDSPIDGPLGDRIFSFSEKHGIPFQIHYEVEDGLLPALEKELGKYPGARVIWCHFGRVRLKKKSTVYGPEYVEKLLKTYPNLYFDTSCVGRHDKYPPDSGDYASELWDDKRTHLKPEWKALVEKYPWRFLAALDIGGDRSDPETVKWAISELRRFLAELSPGTREIVAYKAAWKLLFQEELK